MVTPKTPVKNLTFSFLFFLLFFSFILPIASAQSQNGIKAERIAAKIDSMLVEYNRKNPVTHSLILYKNDKRVLSKYYNGFSAGRLNNLKSVTKSITSLLIGILVDQGKIKSIDQTIYELFPEYFVPGVDEAKKKITVRHLLTMSAGFEWNNFGGKARNGWDAASDKHKYVIQKLKMIEEPGKVWNYNSSLSHLLSGIVSKYSGMSTGEFARRFLFEPLGIKNFIWPEDKNGDQLGNSELQLTSEDMAKIGLLMLNKGIWNGKRIISANWIDASTRAYFKGFPQIGGYGFQWHTRNFGKYGSFLAAGWGGQFIIVIPEINIVLVLTSKWNVNKSSYVIFDILEQLFS